MSSSSASCRIAAEPLVVREVGTIDYTEAWDLQREILAARADDTGPDTMLLLEHPSVYTAGKRTEPEDRPADGTPVIDVDRGGKITWHGPGQLVGYPILKLADPIDVMHYVRRLEEALIAVCDRFGVRTGRVEGRSGVWIPADERGIERKIAAIGIRVQRGVTMHGFELNCNADLAAFDTIVPCGIRDAGVTSLSYELRRDVPVAEVLPLAKELVLAALEGELPVSDDRWLPRPEAPKAPGVTFALQN
ncbi:lipoyl(octanoyl) transferase LipB [Amycolatopsis rubida]|uniref:Octanoyltransferase n=1 Tax=Amycolatopsis rubida TaxID=112413 RepID=A0A1I5YN71_9PSEU|nr:MULTISPECIES: lipoyl(octanoyl) transferase LipB [Amycolatopsis]MYW95048.1 lipoyl(octanoyl) transferase LipB [Amycolatopsis rubida]NEC60035.1 lipoyl(octanoyl) transferase LipB [Amycolatopsis rubida]OAP28211.1 Octanoyltransferase [Amycolatopsis sp. M39]SFQ45698.1 lipoyl(octanoyl) transferase [Amycolatopsis rubida]